MVPVPTVRLEIDDVGDFRTEVLAPCVDEANRAWHMLQDAAAPNLGAFDDATQTRSRHETIVDEFAANLQAVTLDLVAAIIDNETLMEIFREHIDLSMDLLARLTDPVFREIELDTILAAHPDLEDPTGPAPDGGGDPAGEGADLAAGHGDPSV